MEIMPIPVLLLYSIPEGIIIITLGSALYRYKVKENFYRIILLGICLALITYIIRMLPIKFGFNAFIEIPLFIFLTSRFLKVSLLRAFFYILTGFIILMLAENISLSFAMFVLHLPAKIIFTNIYLRIFIGWFHLFLMAVIALLVLKKNISLITAASFFQPKTRTGKITLLLLSLVIIQAVLSGYLNLIPFSVWPSLNNIVYRRITGFFLFTVPLISIFLVKRMFTLSEQEVIAETQEAFLDNINRLFTTIRGQRHDFNKHVQVIYAMLNNNEVKEATDYMDNLLDDIQSVSNVIKVKDPVLSALLNTKTAVAERLKINLEINLETPLEGLHLKPYEVVKILGNLIDNALEAVTDQPPEFKHVKVNLRKLSSAFIFEISNPRPIISSFEINKIFEGGYTTKEGHSGLGLALVKDLVERLGGDITVKSNEEEGTTFTVVIPAR